jgi:hypothetical protein
MENHQGDNQENSAEQEVSPGGRALKPTKNKRKRNDGSKITRNRKKWSIWRHVKSASWRRRIAWLCGGLIAAATVTIPPIYVWDHIQRDRQFSAEHKPHVEIVQPPVLEGDFTCDVGEKEIHSKAGKHYVWVKNTSTTGNATDVYVSGPTFRLIPKTPTGIDSVDNFPKLSEETCNNRPRPEYRLFNLSAGREMLLPKEIGFGTELIVPEPTLNMNPQKPEHPHESGIVKGPVNNLTEFMLYAPTCVFYSDYDHGLHATCVSYHLKLTDGRYYFSCQETPIRGKFERTLSDYCEN